jgi:hypothetical protein
MTRLLRGLALIVTVTMGVLGITRAVRWVAARRVRDRGQADAVRDVGPNVATFPTVVAPDPRLDLGTLEFEWSVRLGDPAMVEQELTAAGVPFEASDPTSTEGDFALAHRLEAVGIHLDQEPGAAFGPARARYVGSTSPMRLSNALNATLTKAHTGLVVDAVDAHIEIDEHQDVGTHVLALIEPGGARLVHAEAARTLLEALRSAAQPV